MFGFQRGRKSANTLPIFTASSRSPFARSLIAVFTIPTAMLLALIWFGSPAIRIAYTWNGNQYAPYYHRCDYLSLLHGWKRLSGHCPFFITTHPVTLSDFYGSKRR